LGEERLVLLAPLDDAVRGLLLEGPRDLLRLDNVGRRREGSPLFLSDVAGDTDQPAKLSQSERELPAATGPPLCFPEDLEDRPAIEVRDLLVLRCLLCDKPDQLLPV